MYTVRLYIFLINIHELLLLLIIDKELEMFRGCLIRFNMTSIIILRLQTYKLYLLLCIIKYYK